jgi:hypothetical protein
MDLTKIGVDTRWQVAQGALTLKQDTTGFRHIDGFKNDAKSLKASTSVKEMLSVKRSKNKRQFMKAAANVSEDP